MAKPPQKYWERVLSTDFVCLEIPKSAWDNREFLAPGSALNVHFAEVVVSFNGPPNQRSIGLLHEGKEAFAELFKYLADVTPTCLSWSLLQAINSMYFELHGKHPVIRKQDDGTTITTCASMASAAAKYVEDHMLGRLPEIDEPKKPKKPKKPKYQKLVSKPLIRPAPPSSTQSHGMVQKLGGYVHEAFNNPTSTRIAPYPDELPAKQEPPKPFQSPGKRKFKHGK